LIVFIYEHHTAPGKFLLSCPLVKLDIVPVFLRLTDSSLYGSSEKWSLQQCSRM